jgi:deoxyribonuclease-1-like protein
MFVMKKILISILMLLAFLSLSCAQAIPDPIGNSPTEANNDTITIASFNIQIFGVSKAGKPEVMDILAQIIRRYDIVAIQEIRDISETAIVDLRNEVNSDGGTYEVITSPRLGRTSSKEQYAFMYDTAAISYKNLSVTYDDDGDLDGINNIDDSMNTDTYEREPYAALFGTTSGSFDFVLVNIHIKPDDATAEINLLPDVIDFVSTSLGEPDIICLGDFNADGSYYSEDDYLTVFPATDYLWLIPNTLDTTVAVSDNTYDRFATTIDLANDYAESFGVLYFDQEYDFSALAITPNKVSDHYPIWAEFYVAKDSD